MKSLLLRGLALAGFSLVVSQFTTLATPKIGVFPTLNDGNAKAKVDQYEAWLGRPMDYILQGFANSSWSSFSGNGVNWWIGQWASYPQIYRDRMVISLPMLPDPVNGSTLASGATGAYNSHWSTIATKLVAAGYGNCVLRPGWEFNGNWYTWSAIGKETHFKNYWIQIVDTMRAVPGANFKFCWNPTVGGSSMNPMNAWPGAAYVDFIGLDVYDTYSGYGTAGYPDAMPQWQIDNIRNNGWLSIRDWGSYNLTFWKNQSNSLGVPLAIVEWGLDNPAPGNGAGYGGKDNTTFVRKMKDWIYDPANNVAWHMYFEWGYGTSSRNHAIYFSDQYPNAKALYPTLFGDMLDETFEDNVANDFTASPTSQWSVVSDSGDKAYKFDFNWSSQSGTATAGLPTWTNYTVTTDFKITDLQGWCETHVHVRRVDSNNLYDVMVQDYGGTRRIYLRKKVGGTFTNLANANVTINANTWYTLSVSVNGSNLSVAFNGAPLLSATDTSHTAGGMALSVWKSDVLFDNVLVQ